MKKTRRKWFSLCLAFAIIVNTVFMGITVDADTTDGYSQIGSTNSQQNEDSDNEASNKKTQDSSEKEEGLSGLQTRVNTLSSVGEQESAGDDLQTAVHTKTAKNDTGGG